MTTSGPSARNPERLLTLLLVAAIAIAGGGCGGNVGDDPGDDDDTDDPDDPGDPVSIVCDDDTGEVPFLGPWGGEVTQIEPDPTNPHRLFALATGHLFRSGDSGATWLELSVPMTSGFFEIYSIAALDDGRLFVGTTDDVLLSEDAGESFRSVRGNLEQGGAQYPYAYGFSYVPGSVGRLWVSLLAFEVAPVWYLEDGSDDWVAWNTPAGSAMAGAYAFLDVLAIPGQGGDPSTILALWTNALLTDGGVICSVDGGETFEDCSSGLPDRMFQRARYLDGHIVLAGGHPVHDSFAGVYYTDDPMDSWYPSIDGWSSPVAHDVMQLDSGEFVAASYGQGLMKAATLNGEWEHFSDLGEHTVHALGKDVDGRLYSGVEQLGVFASDDGGASWTQSSECMDLAVVSDATLDPVGGTYLLAMSSLNSGMVVSGDGATDGWSHVDSLPPPRFSGVHIGESGNWYAVTDGPSGLYNDGLLASADQGESFEFIGPQFGQSMDHVNLRVIEEGDAQHLLVAGNYFWSYSFLKRSEDGGESWSDVWDYDTGTGSDTMVVDLIRLPDGGALIAAQWEGIHHVTPEGEGTVLAVPEIYEGLVTDIDWCPGEGETPYPDDPGRLFVSGVVDGNSGQVGMFLSDDGGLNWTELDPDGLDSHGPIFGAFYPADCDRLVVASVSGEIMSSEDGGATWSELEVGRPIEIHGATTVHHTDDLSADMLLYGLGGTLKVELTAVPQ